jgi:ribosomal protein L34E
MKLQKKPAGARAFSLRRIFKKGPGNEVVDRVKQQTPY